MSEWDDLAGKIRGWLAGEYDDLPESRRELLDRAAALLRRAGRLEAKLQRVRDALKSMANSEGGLVDEIDAALAPEGGGK